MSTIQTTIKVTSLNDSRTAYEIEQHLLGLPSVSDIHADVSNDEITVTYDALSVSDDALLDKIEHAGCTPVERKQSIIDKISRTMLG